MCDYSGCTAVYYPTCTGLSCAPKRRWLCPGCTHAPGKAVRLSTLHGDTKPEDLLADTSDEE